MHGKVLVISHDLIVFIFSLGWHDTTWAKLGLTMSGKADGDLFGGSVSLVSIQLASSKWVEFGSMMSIITTNYRGPRNQCIT
jgi:hypothetical protein